MLPNMRGGRGSRRRQLSLSGVWNVKGDEHECAATVPGYVQIALGDAGFIPRNLNAGVRGEALSKQVASQQWRYTCSFNVHTDDLVPFSSVALVFEGVDTFASVVLNGRQIGETCNAFRSYELAVPAGLLMASTHASGLAHGGANTLEVVLHPVEDVILAAVREAETRGESPVPCMEYPNGVRHRCYVRKPGCHFGWDWGPCMLPVGIPRPVRLIFRSEVDPHISQVLVEQTRLEGESDAVLVSLTAGVCVPPSAIADVELEDETVGVLRVRMVRPDTCPLPHTSCQPPTACALYSFEAGLETPLRRTDQAVSLTRTLDVVIEDPVLWWPVGMGEQHRYTVEIELLSQHGVLLQTMEKQLGIRSVQLVTHKNDPVDTLQASATALMDSHFGGMPVDAEPFYFLINGRPVYAKGANYIPSDLFETESSTFAARVETLLQSVVEANMNMVRVWGGGSYCPPAFYTMCDRLGIMVFHDFMFACSLYPADTVFLNNVCEEVTQQMQRLSWHCSVVCWCGNNENEEAMLQRYFKGVEKNPHKYVIEYSRLYDDTIYQAFRRLFPKESVPFWPSSPSNGMSKFGTPWDTCRGDCHYWGVWHGEAPFSEYLRIFPRFCSEFGFQSLPALQTLQEVLEHEEEFNLTSPAMEYRQRSPVKGNRAMLDHVARMFRLPDSFGGFVYLSQVLQALSIKTAVEHWRRLRPYCMGTLYWQLNDVWQGPSWSSVDFTGRWKILHHFARHFFAPVLLSCCRAPPRGESHSHDEEDPDYVDYCRKLDMLTDGWNELQVWITNDTQRSWQLETLHVSLWDLRTGAKKIARLPMDVSIGPGESKPIGELDVAALFKVRADHVAQHFLRANLQEALPGPGVTLRGGCVASLPNDFFFAPLKRAALGDPMLVLTYLSSDKRPTQALHYSAVSAWKYMHRYSVSCGRGVAPFVWLRCMGSVTGRFSDNGFTLVSGETKTVEFVTDWADASSLSALIGIMSLRDSYA